MTRLSLETRYKPRKVLEIIHSDVLGPFDPLSNNIEKYFVSSVDDLPTFVKVYHIKNKRKV